MARVKAHSRVVNGKRVSVGGYNAHRTVVHPDIYRAGRNLKRSWKHAKRKNKIRAGLFLGLFGAEAGLFAVSQTLGITVIIVTIVSVLLFKGVYTTTRYAHSTSRGVTQSRKLDTPQYSQPKNKPKRNLIKRL